VTALQAGDFIYEVTTVESGVTEHLGEVAYANGQYMVVGNAGTIITSTDGVSWTPRVSNTSDNLKAVAYGNGTWVVGGSWYPTPNVLIASTDNGVTWSSSSLYSGHYATQSIIYQDGAFIAVTFQGFVLRSYSGLSWTDLGNATGATLHDITYGDGLYVVAGYLGRMGSATSPTGPWKTMRPSNKSSYGVAYGNGVYVMVGNSGEIWTSTTGTGGWTLRPSGTTENIGEVEFADNRFLAVGNAGTVLASPDGTVWTSLDIGLSQNLHGLAYDGLRFIMVGENGLIAYLSEPDPVISFAGFFSSDIRVHIGGENETDNFFFAGSLVLGESSDGVDPVGEEVEVRAGPYTMTIPPGSLQAQGKRYVWSGEMDGAGTKMTIRNIGQSAYAFAVQVYGVDLSGWSNPEEWGLTIGDDTGSSTNWLKGHLRDDNENW
jgi:hypothetical protein